MSQLRCAHGVANSFPDLPSQLSPEIELVVELEGLLEVHPKAIGLSGDVEVLIQWKGMPPFEATWEDFQAIHMRFLDFHLLTGWNFGREVMLGLQSGSRILGAKEGRRMRDPCNRS